MAGKKGKGRAERKGKRTARGRSQNGRQGRIEMESELRLERIRELKESVRNGTYKIDAHKVAEKMLFELWDDLNYID